MDMFPALLTFCEGNQLVTGGSSLQKLVAPSFDVFFDVQLSKRLKKQGCCRWFEKPWRSFDVIAMG